MCRQARDGALLQRVQEELARRPVAENDRLLSADTGLTETVAWSRRPSETVAQRSAIIRRSASTICSVWATSPSLRSFHGGGRRSHAGRSEGRQFGHFDPAQAYADCTAECEPACARRQRRHGHWLRLFRCQGAHGRKAITVEPAQLAADTGCW